VLQMHAGPEIGVASTKAFSTMIVAGYLLGLWLGRQRGALTAEDVRKHIQDLVEIPRLVEKTLELDQPIAALARHLAVTPPPWVRSVERPDNWQTSAWERPTMLPPSARARADDTHF